SARVCGLAGDPRRSNGMRAGLGDWSFFVEHRAEILGATLEHVELVLIAMLIAMLIAVPLGMFIVQRPALRVVSIGIANVFQTIPSLALFGFLIPIPFIGGVGKRTAAVVRGMCARLTVLRHPYAGVSGVDPPDVAG